MTYVIYIDKWHVVVY